MKFITNYLEYFISPITGRLISSSGLPPLHEGKIWVGNEDDVAVESEFSIDDFVKNEGDSFVSGDIAIWSDTEGQFIKDGGMSIPDLKSLAEAAAASADAAKSSAETASIAATLAGGYKTEAEAAAASAAGDAAAALASAGEATAAAVLAATYAGDAAESADDAYDEAVLANNYQKEAKEARDAAQAAAASALASKNTCEDILSELYSTGIEFVGDITGMGPVNSPILTTLNLTLDQIPWASAAVNLNSQKITNLANGVAANDAVNISQLAAFTGTITQYAILSGGAANTINSVGPATAGKIIRATGLTSQPAFTTATYPDTTTANRILYSSATNIIGEITSANNSILRTDGSAVPSFSTTLPSGLAATNLTLTTPILGTPQSGNLSNCTGIPAGGISGTVLLANGGSSANLTASNGGIVYSTASALAILAGTSTAGQILTSGATAAPSWKSRCIDYGNSGGANAGTLFVGTDAGSTTATTIPGNTGIGVAALTGITSSRSNNTAIGYGSLSAFSDGNRNTAVGALTGVGGLTVTSNDNCFFGYQAGSARVNYTQCVLIGSGADCGSGGLTNAIAIGYGASVSASNCMVLGNGVKVGIGTSDPTAPTTNSVLTLNGTSNTMGRISLTGQDYWSASQTSTNGVNIYLGFNATNNRQIFFADSAHAKNTTNVGLRIGIFPLTYSGVYLGAINTDGSAVKALTIESSTLYSTTDTVTKPTAGAWTAASDIRIKENIKKYTRGLSEVLKLNPVEYQLNKASGYSQEMRDKINQGLIANEVEEIMPECVGRIEHRDLGKIRSLDITPITYAMVNAIKELNNRLETLEKAA